MKIELKLTENTSKDFCNDLFTMYNCCPYARMEDSDEFSIPWDAGYYIKDDLFYMEGHAGSNGYGYELLGIPMKDAIEVVTLEVEVGEAEVMEVLKYMTDTLKLRLLRVS